jgi:serine/threonine protein kinase
MPESWFMPQVFGKYVLTERIGAGGMAEIFRATAFGVEGFTKEVCIKRILPTLSSDETFVRMFVGEAKIAVSLHHANIVQVFDLGRIGEHYFIAMELVRGRDLLQVINQMRARKQRIPVPIALYVLSEVLRGLDYAHRVKVEGRPLGLIHRDVSPSNILISWEGEVKVADFGIAKAAAVKDEKTATGTMKGKYGYMSPEQVRGERIDHRSDVFAAGILLYESLVGARLFKGETDLDTLERVRAARVNPLPSQVNKEIPASVEAVILKALSLEREKRFQTAGAMRDALLDCLYGLGQRVDAKVLSAFMGDAFAQAIQEEEERDRQRASLPLPVPPQVASLPPASATAMIGPPTSPGLPPGASLMTSPPKSPIHLAAWIAGILFFLGGVAVILVFFFYRERNHPPPVPLPAMDAGSPLDAGPPTPGVVWGTLTVGSTPSGAQVILNGNPTGKVTPATIGGLERSKPQTISLELAGYKSWSKSVEFGTAETLVVDAQLMLLSPPEPPKPPEVQPARPAMGTVNINAVPVWAWVYIDGQKQEKPTPIFNLRLKAGTYTVRLENPHLKIVKVQKVTVKKNETLDLVVRMKD